MVQLLSPAQQSIIDGSAYLRGFAKFKKKLDRAHIPPTPLSKLFWLETNHRHGQNTQIIVLYKYKV